MQGQASRAGVPFTALRVIVQAFVELPGFAAVFADEQRGGLRTGMSNVRLALAPRLDVPDLDHFLWLFFDAFAALRAEGFLHSASGPARFGGAREERHLLCLGPGLAQVIGMMCGGTVNEVTG